MGSEFPEIATRLYGAAAVVFLLFAVYLLLARRAGGPGGSLLIAVVTTAAWALSSALVAYAPNAMVIQAASVLDVARTATWFAFLLILLQPLGAERAQWPAIGAGAVVLLQLLAVLAGGFEWTLVPGLAALRLQLGGFLIGAVFGLVLVEQLFRGVPAESRWGVKPLCLALAAGFTFELYLFADGFLFGRLDADVWGARGAAHALVVPLLAVAVARNPEWTSRLSVSREMVFHSTALAVSGLYLLVIAGAGYYVRYFGGDWGRALQATLLFGGMLVLGVLVFSGAQRARLRVFINKHLFPYRYDYRNEWLRFTHALSASGGGMDLGTSVIKALSDLVESPGGVLWMHDSSGRFKVGAHLNQLPPDVIEQEGSDLVTFLREREWIVNLEEYRTRPGRYAGLVLPEWLSAMPGAWLVLPLKSSDALIGFIVLSTPRTPFEINWEVLDLLKTAQRQAGSYLARMQATEALLEARKFDSFNRMSAFVVHDLKNLVAQLSLMMKNAERHRDNPEFQADMLETVAHVESRMRALMTQLQEKRSIDAPRRVELRTLVQRIASSKRLQRPLIDVALPTGDGAEVLAHPERLERVIGHLVQNALDATPEDGKVVVHVDRMGGGLVRLTVNDSGCGMTPEFLRERLFKPFQTSKKSGMGIGVYESQQYLNEIGGRIRYESTPAKGTTVIVEMPVAPRARPSEKGASEGLVEYHD